MASIVDTSVKHADSSMAGAPVISGTAGSLIAAMDAFLVTGWGSKAVDSATVSGGVCRLNFASGKSAAERHAVILVAGAAPAGLNGEQKVTAVSSTWVEFAAALPDGPVSGSVSFKMAPLGWEKVFTATNKAAYRATDPQSTRMYLSVDDTGTTNARVRFYEAMTDAVTGVGATPLESQVAGGLYWPKSSIANATARNWRLMGDSRGFYLAVEPARADRYTLLFVGDIASFKSGDAYGCLLTGNQSDQTNLSGSAPDGCVGYSHRNARGGAYLVRAHTGLGQSIAVQRIGAHHNGSAADAYAGSTGYSVGTYPNGPNNGLMTAPLELFALGLRGTLAGLLHPVQDCGSTFATGASVDGTDELQGRRLVAIRTGPPDSGALGTVFLDTTGPWER